MIGNKVILREEISQKYGIEFFAFDKIEFVVK